MVPSATAIPAANYLLSVSHDGRAHVVHVPVRWDGDALAADVGQGSAANAGEQPTAVSLLFPVQMPADYSLIVDGTATSRTGSRRAPAWEPVQPVSAPTKPTTSACANSPAGGDGAESR